jgi:DNA polymerase I-like protein with 3'-5' exonuclease and polymerase domains
VHDLHDELILEVRAVCAPAIVAACTHAMRTAYTHLPDTTAVGTLRQHPLLVPLLVNSKMGMNWAEMQ